MEKMKIRLNKVKEKKTLSTDNLPETQFICIESRYTKMRKWFKGAF